MDRHGYRFASFNCKSVKRSVDSVRELCRTCDLIALQETWLLPEEITYLGTIDSGFGYTGTSAVDTSAGILRGRPFGGVALLWRSSVFQQVSVLQCDNARISALKVTTKDRPVLVMSIYMPTNCADNLPDFTDCLSAVSAIIDEHNIQSVFMLGDFNADINELFYNELFSFCSEQYLSCIDVDILGVDSGTYTFISDAHGTCSWLDHCIVTQSAKRSVTNVYVNYDTLWSDHFPIIIECDLGLLTPKLQNEMSLNDNTVSWGTRTKEQIAKYTTECHERLRLIDFPTECINCADFYCNDPYHHCILDVMYSDIVSALRDASSAGREGRRRSGGGSRIVGWNKHVSEAHRKARMKFTEWVSCGKPNSGLMYDEMCASRRVFKSHLKWCQDHQDQIKMDSLAEKHAKGDFRGFWKNTNKVNVKPGVPLGGNNDSKHFLLYYYYGGMIYTAMKNYDRALYFFEVVVTVPAMVVSHIMLEAYKKYILVSFILHGKILPMPKYTSQVVCRFLKPLSVAYHELANSQHAANKHRETFVRDKNMGLVNQVLSSMYKKNIQRLTKTFLTLSLSDVAARVQLGGPSQAETYILNMIEEGEIYAMINQKDGMVVFLDSPEKYASPETLCVLEQQMAACTKLHQYIQEMDEQIQVNPQYVKKSVGSHDEDIPATSQNSKTTYSM